MVGLGSALGAALIGVSIGAYTAYRGGWWDSIFLRISEIFMAFPQIILVLLLVSVLGQSLMNLIQGNHFELFLFEIGLCFEKLSLKS